MNKEEKIIGGLWEIVKKKMTLDNTLMKNNLSEYNPSEIHFIDYVGNNKDANVTILANNFYMTRGAISRLSKKLIAKELIESYQKEDNQKEIYFRLTNKGIDIFNTHNKVHNEILKRDRKVFDAINDNDYKTIINFIDYYRNHLENELKHLNIRESDKM